jgi:hypothetical protein
LTISTGTEVPLKSFSVGILVFILTPLAVLFCSVIIVGLPIAVILVYLFGALCFGGLLYGILLVGYFILSKIRTENHPSFYLSALLGVILMVIIAGIPYLGTLIIFLVTFFGIGALLLSVLKLEKTGRA